MKKYYVTKYALTVGIQVVEGVVEDEGYTLKYTIEGDRSKYFAFGNDWYSTRECAQQRAELLKARKLRSLEKQVRLLRSLDFRVLKDGESLLG